MAKAHPGETVLKCRLRKRLLQRQQGSFELEVEFETAAGITVLFGHSGAGKTTLLNCIAGVTGPDEGYVRLAGNTLFDSGSGLDVPPRQRHLGYVFQTLALFPHQTVRENVEYGLFELAPGERHNRANALLQAFGIAALAEQYPRAISGGERQRTALARALVTRPRALLLDEPLTALDLTVKQQIAADLRQWVKESEQGGHRITVLYVTHALDEVFALADHVIVLENGKIVRQGTAAEVLERERKTLLKILAVS